MTKKTSLMELELLKKQAVEIARKSQEIKKAEKDEMEMHITALKVILQMPDLKDSKTPEVKQMVDEAYALIEEMKQSKNTRR